MLIIFRVYTINQTRIDALQKLSREQFDPKGSASETLLQITVSHAVGIIRGEIDPVALLFSPSCAPLLTEVYESYTDCSFVLGEILKKATQNKLNTNGIALRILEVGAGTGAATSRIHSKQFFLVALLLFEHTHTSLNYSGLVMAKTLGPILCSIPTQISPLHFSPKQRRNSLNFPRL